MWLLFLALHLVGIVGYSLLLRKSLLANMDRWTLATLMQTGISIPIIAVVIFKPPDVAVYDLHSAAIISVAALLVILLHLTNVKALQHLEASTFSVLYNLRILFTTVLGVLFLSEEIVPLQIVGGLLIFLAVLTVRQKGKDKLPAAGIWWGVAAAICISFLNLSEKHLISNVGIVEYAVPAMILATGTMWSVLLLRKRPVDLTIFTQPRMLWLMTLRALSAYGFLLVFYFGGLLSVSTYISSLSVILIVVLGVLLLNENDYLKQKVIATTLATLGLTAILLANIL